LSGLSDCNYQSSWGESAGAISVALHMVANHGNTEGLFRGGFMQSGSPIPVGDITHGQKYYNTLVADTGCSGTEDTLDCLRTVPYDKLKASLNKSPGIFAYQVGSGICYGQLIAYSTL
jgi:acetylcholinesterase